MDEKTMFELLEIYDAEEELHRILVMLIGDDMATGYEEGILGKLSRVTNIIKRYSPLYCPGMDYDKSELCRVLEDTTIDNHKKSRRILGIEA